MMVDQAAVIGTTKAFVAECTAMGVRVDAALAGIAETQFAAAPVDVE